jgi:hypothetical protein
MLTDLRNNINFQDVRKTLSFEIAHYECQPAECRIKDLSSAFLVPIIISL